MSAVATAGAVAWVVPEILTAKPAAGAAMSSDPGGGSGSPGVSTSASGTGDPGTGSNGPDGAFTASAITPAAGAQSSLAYTGLNIQRDVEIGAAMVAGGWAMKHWASRRPERAVAGLPETPSAESTFDGA